MSQSVHVGLAICSHDKSQISQARFRGLEIKQR
jgi:hypothetical protein